jgi:hypothetical protein
MPMRLTDCDDQKRTLTWKRKDYRPLDDIYIGFGDYYREFNLLRALRANGWMSLDGTPAVKPR